MVSVVWNESDDESDDESDAEEEAQLVSDYLKTILADLEEEGMVAKREAILAKEEAKIAKEEAQAASDWWNNLLAVEEEAKVAKEEALELREQVKEAKKEAREASEAFMMLVVVAMLLGVIIMLKHTFHDIGSSTYLGLMYVPVRILPLVVSELYLSSRETSGYPTKKLVLPK